MSSSDFCNVVGNIKIQILYIPTGRSRIIEGQNIAIKMVWVDKIIEIHNGIPYLQTSYALPENKYLIQTNIC